MQGEAPGWSQLPPDVLLLVISYSSSSRTTAVLLKTCAQWNRSIKSQLMELQPFYLDQAWQTPFWSVRRISAPYIRSGKHKEFTRFHAPLRYSPQTFEGFPNLTHLDLSGQDLPDSLFSKLLPALQTLQLAGCRLRLQALAEALPRLTNLQRLCLAGIRAPDVGSAIPAFLSALCNSCAHKLTALDLSNISAFWETPSPAAGGVVTWQHTESRLSVAGLPAVLQLSGASLHSLSLRRQRMSMECFEAIAHCTALRDLDLTWYGMQPHGASRGAAHVGLTPDAWVTVMQVRQGACMLMHLRIDRVRESIGRTAPFAWAVLSCMRRISPRMGGTL